MCIDDSLCRFTYSSSARRREPKDSTISRYDRRTHRCRSGLSTSSRSVYRSTHGNASPIWRTKQQFVLARPRRRLSFARALFRTVYRCVLLHIAWISLGTLQTGVGDKITLPRARSFLVCAALLCGNLFSHHSNHVYCSVGEAGGRARCLVPVRQDRAGVRREKFPVRFPASRFETAF